MWDTSFPPNWAKVVPAPTNRRCRPCACPVCPSQWGQGQRCAWRSVWKEATTWKKGCLAEQSAVQLKNVDSLGGWESQGKNGKTGMLGQDRLEVRLEAVMFLFNVVNLNVWLFLFDYLAKCFVEVVVIMFGLNEGDNCWGGQSFYV